MKEKFWVPEWFVGYATYGDEWEVTDEEKADYIMFCHKHGLDGYACWGEAIDHDEFRWSNDVNHLGGACELVEVWQPQKSKLTLADRLMNTTYDVARIVLDRLNLPELVVVRACADRDFARKVLEVELPDGSLYIHNIAIFPVGGAA